MITEEGAVIGEGRNDQTDERKELERDIDGAIRPGTTKSKEQNPV